MNHNPHAVSIKTKSTHAGQNIRHSCDMVCPEDVDDYIIATLQLVAVVGNVGQPVRWLTRRLYDHLVLLVSELRQGKPCGSVFLVDQTFGTKFLDC